MYRLIVFLACLVICKGHAVLPVIAPVVHAVPAPVLTPYISHGYAGLGFGHGYLGKSLGHHIYKRSPHVVPVDKYEHIGGVGHIGAFGHVGGYGHVGAGHLGHLAGVAPVAAIAPIAISPAAAVSHQSRVDVHSSPAVVAAPVVAPVIAPIYSKPLSHFHLGGYGAGHFGHKY